MSLANCHPRFSSRNSLIGITEEAVAKGGNCVNVGTMRALSEDSKPTDCQMLWRTRHALSLQNENSWSFATASVAREICFCFSLDCENHSNTTGSISVKGCCLPFMSRWVARESLSGFRISAAHWCSVAVRFKTAQRESSTMLAFVKEAQPILTWVRRIYYLIITALAIPPSKIEGARGSMIYSRN